MVAKIQAVQSLIHHPTVGALGWALGSAVAVGKVRAVVAAKAQVEEPGVLNLSRVYSEMM